MSDPVLIALIATIPPTVMALCSLIVSLMNNRQGAITSAKIDAGSAKIDAGLDKVQEQVNGRMKELVAANQNQRAEGKLEEAAEQKEREERNGIIK